MAVLYKSNVEEAISNKPDSITAFNLAVAAIDSTGLRNVLAAYADSDQLPYFASDNAGLWEQGIGTVTGTTLVRTVVNESSNANAAVDFSAGGAINLHVEAGADSAQGVVFMAAGLTSAISIPSATFTVLKNWIVLKDSHGLYDAASGEFRPNISGYYQVNGSCNYQSTGDTHILRVNGCLGSGWSARLRHASTSYVGGFVNRIVYCDGVTDVILLEAYQTTAASAATQTTSNDISFSVAKVGS